jgi:protein phosphatase
MGEVVVASRQSPWDERTNEDAAAAFGLADGSVLLAVADGAGGMPGGRAAAAAAIEALTPPADHGSAREHVVHAFEVANERIMDMGVGAATTLVVAHIDPHPRVRTFHAGDSVCWLVGQRGKRKAATMPHNMTAYAVEAGLMTEREAHDHETHATLTNCLGLEDLRIDVASATAIAQRDTLMLMSDGVTDNLTPGEIIDTVRTGPLAAAATALLERAQQRMTAPTGDELSKPDDATVVLFRPRRR